MYLRRGEEQPPRKGSPLATRVTVLTGIAVAMLVFLATAVRWIRDVRRDIAELPLEHHH